MTWHRRRISIKYYDKAVAGVLGGFEKKLLRFSTCWLFIYQLWLNQFVLTHSSHPAVIITPNHLDLHLKFTEFVVASEAIPLNQLWNFKAGHSNDELLLRVENYLRTKNNKTFGILHSDYSARCFLLAINVSAKKVLIEKLLILVRENGKVKLFPSPKQFIKIFPALLTCFSSIFPTQSRFFFYYEAINQDVNDSTGNYKNDSFLLAASTSDGIDRKSGEFSPMGVCFTGKWTKSCWMVIVTVTAGCHGQV